MNDASDNKPKQAWQEWESLFPASSEGSGSREGLPKADWLKFDKPGTYDVRLVGKPVGFLKHGSKPYGVLSKRTITHESYKEQDLVWKAGFYPKKGYAINVIDRRDGSIKVLEKGKTIFEAFQNFKATNEINPSDSQKAPDFQIKVVWPEGNKNKAEYTVTPKMKATPFTAEEIETIKQNAIDLRVLYKPSDLNFILEQWSQVPEDQRVPPKSDRTGGKKTGNQQASVTKAKEIKEKVETPVTDESDLFSNEASADDNGSF